MFSGGKIDNVLTKNKDRQTFYFLVYYENRLKYENIKNIFAEAF